MKAILGASAAFSVICSPALAAEQDFTASNGLVVSVSADDFRPNKDVSAPVIRDGKAGVSYIYAVRKLPSGSSLHLLQGLISYSGDWRFYDRAYLKGGEAAEFNSLDRKVGYCGRYSRGCSLSETFMVRFTDEQVAAAKAAGALAVQVGSPSAGVAIVLTVPLTHLDAVDEVANRALADPAPSPPP